jgi:predicted site-specific integrase-resolvase
VLNVSRKSESEWLNATQLADHFGVSTMTISRWKKDPELNFPDPRLVNGREYYSRSVADQWMEAQPASKTAKAG